MIGTDKLIVILNTGEKLKLLKVKETLILKASVILKNLNNQNKRKK